MRHRHPVNDPPAPERWTYLETIDEANSVIRVRGRVDELGVDLLRGTIEELSRRGHRHITVTVQHLGDVDAYAGTVLAEVATAVEEAGGGLIIQWSPAAANDDDLDLTARSAQRTRSHQTDSGHSERGMAARPVSVGDLRGRARPSSPV